MVINYDARANMDMAHIRNAVWFEAGRIDCEWEHPSEGWIWYSSSEHDVEERGRLMYNMIKDSGDYIVAPEKTAERVLYETRMEAFISKGEFSIRLYGLGILTFEDADLAASGGWPLAFMGAIDGLTDTEKLQSKIRWRSADNVYRLDPLLLLLADYMNNDPNLPSLDEAQLDALFDIAQTAP